MNQHPVDVSVLVPIRNEAAVILDTARQILAQRFEGRLEFLLIDGCSTDGTRELLGRLATEDPRITVLDNEKITVPAALNAGLSAASGRYIVRMDAHAWYPSDYIALGVQRLQRGDTEWVSGPAVPRGAGTVSRAVASALDLSLGRGGSRKWSADGLEETELDTGVFGGVWRRETLERLGGWQEAWIVNEDAEMAGRFLSSGGRIVCIPQMAARYAPRGSLGALARQYWRFGYFRVKTARRYPIALRRSHLAAAALALCPPAALGPRRISRPARLALALYAAVIGAASVRAPDRKPAERASTACALAVMHFGWGWGFLCGCARFGVPWRAVERVARSASSSR